MWILNRREGGEGKGEGRILHDRKVAMLVNISTVPVLKIYMLYHQMVCWLLLSQLWLSGPATSVSSHFADATASKVRTQGSTSAWFIYI